MTICSILINEELSILSFEKLGDIGILYKSSDHLGGVTVYIILYQIHLN